MATEPVRSTTVEPAPKDYSIPNAQQIRLLSVRASFDGSGAGGAWLPALQLLDNNGNVLVTAADPAVSVAAGASADVSWFPGVKVAAAAAASTGVAWFFAKRETNFTIPTTSPQLRIAWTHFVTSDATVFSVTTTTNANDTVNGLKAGVYIAFGQIGWAPPNTYPRQAQIITDFFGVSSLIQTPVSDTSTAATAAGNLELTHDSMFAITNAVPGEISLTGHNYDGSNRNVTAAYYMIGYWPNATLVS